ncbi:hypothetical protein SeLEV6574_g02924 [Synchytrium endobioticum]|uniref:Uncharacterized protein n=1 Tax=Synchytrium endobioticum TaxID=286115 RepID=A0A507D6L1_9FUNG|nr:hypothetical protein SeLEV6574_g02924 [Synchytrium endobioticum]
MRERVLDSMFGPSPPIEYSLGQAVDGISINIAVMSEIVRGAKALDFLSRSKYSPVSSFTECEVVLEGVETPESLWDLYRVYESSENLDHMFYRMLYTVMYAQRLELITTAC